MPRDCAVDPKKHGGRFRRKLRQSNGAFSPVDFSFENVCRLCHHFSFHVPQRQSRQPGTARRCLYSVAERTIEDVLNLSGIDFTGLIVERFATCIRYDDMRDVPHVELLKEALIKFSAFHSVLV